MNKSKKVIVTGCAGSVGSTLSERLLADGYYVTGIDNFSTGKIQFVKNLRKYKKFKLHKFDLLDEKNYRIIKNHSAVFHFAANADVKDGLKHPKKDLEQNTIVTFNVLNALRKNKIKKIIFSSTGSIYGEPKKFPTKEDYKFPVQTSLYGASKLASEGLIQAFSNGYISKVIYLGLFLFSGRNILMVICLIFTNNYKLIQINYMFLVTVYKNRI